MEAGIVIYTRAHAKGQAQAQPQAQPQVQAKAQAQAQAFAQAQAQAQALGKEAQATHILYFNTISWPSIGRRPRAGARADHIFDMPRPRPKNLIKPLGLNPEP